MPNPKDTPKGFVALTDYWPSSGRTETIYVKVDEITEMQADREYNVTNIKVSGKRRLVFESVSEIQKAIISATKIEITHFPGCHKVHIECANKAIEEIIQILIKQDAENQMDDWMHKLHPVYSWLERWKSET